MTGISPDGNDTMTMQTAKQRAETMLRHLPDDCTLEDIQYHLYVLEKIRNKIAARNSGCRQVAPGVRSFSSVSTTVAA
jgi:hypothetical protein